MYNLIWQVIIFDEINLQINAQKTNCMFFCRSSIICLHNALVLVEELESAKCFVLTVDSELFLCT